MEDHRQMIFDRLRNNLNFLLKYNNLSQRQFASKMEIDYGHISKILNGKKQPSYNFLFNCSRIFKLNNAGILIDRDLEIDYYGIEYFI